MKLSLSVALIASLLGSANAGSRHKHPSPSPSPSPSPPPPSLTLAWDPSLDPTVTGYTLWLGFSSGAENTRLEEGLSTLATLQLTSATTYFFVVTAHNASGGDSLPSNEVTYTAP